MFAEEPEKALAALRDKYGGLYRRIAYNILGDPSDAEECVDSALLALWKLLPENPPEELKSYSCRIVRNQALKMFRGSRAAKRNSRFTCALDEIADTLCTEEDGVESAADAAELAEHINAFLRGQKKENRVIFLRRYWFGDSYADIAELTGLSEKNISVRLTRLRASLKKYLTERDVDV